MVPIAHEQEKLAGLEITIEKAIEQGEEVIEKTTENGVVVYRVGTPTKEKSENVD